MSNNKLVDVCADFIRYNEEKSTLIVLNDDGKPVTFTKGTFKFDGIEKLNEGENFLFKAQAWLVKEHRFKLK